MLLFCSNIQNDKRGNHVRVSQSTFNKLQQSIHQNQNRQQLKLHQIILHYIKLHYIKLHHTPSQRIQEKNKIFYFDWNQGIPFWFRWCPEMSYLEGWCEYQYVGDRARLFLSLISEGDTPSQTKTYLVIGTSRLLGGSSQGMFYQSI